MIYFPPAKINIGLYVGQIREDGYHSISTVMVPVKGLCDVLEIHPREGHDTSAKLHLSGRKISGCLQDNIVLKAREAFLAASGLNFGVDIYLDKNIPDGAGLGGGSSDAAFCLKGLNDLAGKPLSDNELREIAATIGADCPFFISPTPALCTGIGCDLENIGLDIEKIWIVIVKADTVKVSTREAYGSIPCGEQLPDLKKIFSRTPVNEWKNIISNDFERGLPGEKSKSREMKIKFYDSGAFYSSMSGSGAAVYGLFDARHKADEAAKEFEDCLVYAGKL